MKIGSGFLDPIPGFPISEIWIPGARKIAGPGATAWNLASFVGRKCKSWS